MPRRALLRPLLLPLLFQDSPQPMWVVDRRTLRFLAVNDAARRLYGYSAKEFAQKTVRDLRLKPDIPRRLAHAGVWTHVKKDGSRFQVDITSHDIDLGGRPARIAMLVDVTKSRQLEMRLRDSEQRYQGLFWRTPVMMHSIDRRGRLVSVSDAWLSALGYKRREVLGRRSTDFLTPASRKRARSVVLPSFYKTGRVRDEPYEFVKKNGQTMDVLLSATAERDESGAVVRSLAVLVDVSARKRDQERLQQATAWYDGLFRSSRDGIVAFTRQREITDVNPAFERLTGYSRHELLGMDILLLTPPEYASMTQRSFDALAKGATSAELELEHVRRDGSRFPVELVAFPVKERRDTLGFAAVVRDVAERRRLEREVAEASGREQSKLGRDLHDTVGQTMTGLALLAKSLRKDLPQGSPTASRAERLEVLSRLAIGQIRGMARGLLPRELHAAGLGGALEELAGGARDLFGIKCEVSLKGPVRALPEAAVVQLYRIAQEALHNAAKHARPLSGVAITLSVEPRAVLLRVADDGVGMPVDGKRGRGLGLTIMRHRAVSIGGSLWARRRRGGGTEIVCACPRPKNGA